MKEIKEQVKELLIKNIQSVISGEAEEVKLLYVRPNTIVEYIKSIGGEYDDSSFDINGWSWDYWFNVEVGGKKYTVSGYGYYSDTANFYISENQD